MLKSNLKETINLNEELKYQPLINNFETIRDNSTNYSQKPPPPLAPLDFIDNFENNEPTPCSCKKIISKCIFL